MNTRPKNTDSEKDIEEMQAAFFKEKETNSNFQPAATFVKIKKKLVTTVEENDVDGDEGASTSEFDIKKEQPERKGDKYVLTDIVLGEIVERVAEISVNDETEDEIDISEKLGFPKPVIADKKVNQIDLIKFINFNKNFTFDPAAKS